MALDCVHNNQVLALVLGNDGQVLVLGLELLVGPLASTQFTVLLACFDLLHICLHLSNSSSLLSTIILLYYVIAANAYTNFYQS